MAYRESRTGSCALPPVRRMGVESPTGGIGFLTSSQVLYVVVGSSDQYFACLAPIACGYHHPSPGLQIRRQQSCDAVAPASGQRTALDLVDRHGMRGFSDMRCHNANHRRNRASFTPSCLSVRSMVGQECRRGGSDHATKKVLVSALSVIWRTGREPLDKL